MCSGVCVCVCVCVCVSQLCPTLSNPMDCSPPGSSVHGILQARVLECVAMPFSSGSSRPRNWTWVCCTAGRLFTICTTREVQCLGSNPDFSAVPSQFPELQCQRERYNTAAVGPAVVLKQHMGSRQCSLVDFHHCCHCSHHYWGGVLHI